MSGISGATSNGTSVTVASNDLIIHDAIATNEVAPSTPASGTSTVYVDSTSKNLTSKNDAGTVNHGVQTQTAVTNDFVTAIADNGTVTVAQPAFSNISGTATVSQGGNGAAPAGNNQVNVSASSSTAAWKTIPDCQDSGGNHINFTQSTNAFSCGTTANYSSALNVLQQLNTPESFSSTPTFDATASNHFSMTLTGNVTSSTLSGAVTSGYIEVLSFLICQDGTGGRTFIWPTNMYGTMVISVTASKCNVQQFRWDGSNAYAISAGMINQ